MEFVCKLTLCNTYILTGQKERTSQYLFELPFEESHLRIVFTESKLRKPTSFVINSIRSVLAVVFGVMLGNKYSLGSHLRLEPIRDMLAEFVGCCPTSERFLAG